VNDDKSSSVKTDEELFSKDVLRRVFNNGFEKGHSAGYREGIEASVNTIHALLVNNEAQKGIINSDSKIKGLGLSTATCNRLRSSRILTVGDLEKRTELSLYRLRGIGDKGVKEIVSMMAKIGHSLADE
jgi:DNA-directed RNA polymerase alpha subunit